MPQGSAFTRRVAIHRTVWALGLVSLFMDVSSELVPRAVMLSGVALWGQRMGLSQGVLAAMVADATPSDLRGTAFGVFNLVCGIALLPASVLAGYL